MSTKSESLYDDSYVDKKAGTRILKVFTGDCRTSSFDNDVMVTVLGSCISACIRDPIANIGGMNHFLLPNSKSGDAGSTRYGAFAMEQLINDLLKQGAKKERLEIKIFGGGNVIDNSANIGDKNVQFVTSYLKDEGLKAVSSDLGGFSARRIHYYPISGKVMMKKLQSRHEKELILEDESSYQNKIDKDDSGGKQGNVELF